MLNNCPLYNFLLQYGNSQIVPFHMPGHKMGKGLSEEFLKNIPHIDITEVPGSDNLHFPEGIIKDAQMFAAKAFGSDMTFFLVNGSTAGILAAVNTVCSKGGKIIAARDCHRSFINAVMFAQVDPVFLMPGIDNEFGIGTFIDNSELENLLRNDKKVQAVYVTRPNYYGICGEVGNVIEIAHKYNKPVIVDEAHGAHLRFSKALPLSAVELGADIVVQSAHKTLPALTQSAYLHVNLGRVDIDRLKANLSMFQTTSPSYVLMASLDIARWVMETDGENMLGRLKQYIEHSRHDIESVECIKMLDYAKANGYGIDWTRLVFNTSGAGITGFEMERRLRAECGIQVEMADLGNIICITTIADEREDIESLFKSVQTISRKYRRDVQLTHLGLHKNVSVKRVVSMREAWDSPYKSITLDKAVGKVSHDIITPYPPGIPILCPGEIITDDVVDYIQEVLWAGGKVNGVSDSKEVNVLK